MSVCYAEINKGIVGKSLSYVYLIGKGGDDLQQAVA
jgi:hypothetical protein